MTAGTTRLARSIDDIRISNGELRVDIHILKRWCRVGGRIHVDIRKARMWDVDGRRLHRAEHRLCAHEQLPLPALCNLSFDRAMGVLPCRRVTRAVIELHNPRSNPALAARAFTSDQLLFQADVPPKSLNPSLQTFIPSTSLPLKRKNNDEFKNYLRMVAEASGGPSKRHQPSEPEITTPPQEHHILHCMDHVDEPRVARVLSVTLNLKKSVHVKT